MHTLTLEFTSTKELLDFASKHLSQNQVTINGTTDPVALAAVPAAEDAPAPRGKKAKVKIEDTADLTPAEETPEKKSVASSQPSASAEVTSSKTLDYKTDVRPTALKLIKAENGSARMGKIFDEFGVTNATELTAEQLPAYLAAVKAELGE
jgi:hypothetical protein